MSNLDLCDFGGYPIVVVLDNVPLSWELETYKVVRKHDIRLLHTPLYYSESYSQVLWALPDVKVFPFKYDIWK